jgi:hypothetical protein
VTISEIDAAARTIRPLLAKALSLEGAVYAPTDPQGVAVIEKIKVAQAELNKVLQFARTKANDA